MAENQQGLLTSRDLRIITQKSISDRIAILPKAPTPAEIRSMVDTAVVEAANSGRFDVTQADVNDACERIKAEFLGFGPLEPLLADDTISEIIVNGGGFDEDGVQLPHKIFIERNGKIVLAPESVKFDNEAHVLRIMNKIAGRMGRHLDQANPIEDATLPDGSRFSGTAYPIDPDGSSFNIRKFQQDRLGYEDLISSGTFSFEQMCFLAACVQAKCAILISGGTGSGKTTLLNVLGGFIPSDERLVTIEDTPELQLKKTHEDITRLVARKANAEGAGEKTLNDLLINTLRRRPDRIIVGECRGPEAYTMLEAMNTGHDGSMTTIHANDPVSALTRLATLVMQGDDSLSENTVKQKISDALDLVVQVQRLSDGSRKCTSIMTVGTFADGVIQHDNLWELKHRGVDENGKFVCEHVACGSQPHEVRKKIEEAGVEYDIHWLSA